jgi:hypothetical protein
MNNWDNVSLAKFQQINEISNRKDLDDTDKLLLQLCAFHDMTHYELNDLGAGKVAKLGMQLARILKSVFNPSAYEMIGEYMVNYFPDEMTLGQYIEVIYFISQDMIQNAHKILASITNVKGEKNNSDHHVIKSEYFLLKSVSETMGCLVHFKNQFQKFNDRYKSLFGIGKDSAEIESDPFFKQYGWIFSATMVADHNRISLDEAYRLPVVQAFGDLAYLKAKGKFEERQINKK